MGANSNDRPGCYGSILQILERIFPSSSEEGKPLPYRLRDDFLSPAELTYYQVLKSVLGSKAAVCAKVRLADLLFVSHTENFHAHFNRISPRHIDFLICEASTMRPVLAIEVDDSSHSRSDRIERDRFIDNAMAAAGFPLLRVEAQRQYSQQQVIDQLKPFLIKPKPAQTTEDALESDVSESPNAEKSTTPPPNCPKCGIPMVLRVATKGVHKGKRFYGCVNFPKCREVLPFNHSRTEM